MKRKLLILITQVTLIAFLFPSPAASVVPVPPCQTLWYDNYVIIPDAVVGGNFYQTENEPEGWGYPSGAYTNSHNTITICVWVPEAVDGISLLFYGEFTMNQADESLVAIVNDGVGGTGYYCDDDTYQGEWGTFVVEGPFSFRQGENYIELRGTEWHDYQDNPFPDANGSIHFGPHEYPGDPGWVTLHHHQLADTPWPMSQHDPQHTGRSPYLGAQTDELKWSVGTGPYIARASPVIGPDGTIYQGSENATPAIGSDGTIYVVRGVTAINPDGTIRWRYEDPEEGFLAISPNGSLKWSHSGPWMTSRYSKLLTGCPNIGPDGTIYIGSRDRNLYAFSPEGILKWKRGLGGFVSSPAIDYDGTIYVGAIDTYTPFGALYALFPDGTQKWKYSNIFRVISPTIASDGTIYVGSEGNLFALDRNGSLKWKKYFGVPGSNYVQIGIGPDGTLYVSFGQSPLSGTVFEPILHALDPKDGTIKWTYTTSNTCSAPTIGSDGTVYIGSEVDTCIYAINLDGTLKWHHAVADWVYSSAAIGSDGTVYIASHDGYLHAFGSVAPNQPPVAIACDDQSVHSGDLVTLDGSASHDPDENYPLSYSWEIISRPAGSEATLVDPNSVSPSFDADLPGDYTVELVVTDSKGLSSEPDQVVVSTYNTPPVADAGADQAVIEIGTTVQLYGCDSWDDDGDPLTYAWSFVSIPEASEATLSPADACDPTFVADVHGDYVIQLIVGDPWASSTPDTVTVSFQNVRPVADAGGNQSVVVGDTVYLNGSSSDDANLDPLTYSWRIASRPADSVAELSDPALVETSFTADVAGEYVVSLVVNDGFVDSEPSNVTIVAITIEDAATQKLMEAQDNINVLDDGTLKNAKLKSPLTNKINAALRMIDEGRYEEALDKLENDILGKTNGCVETGAPDRNDWIEDCDGQSQVYPIIMEAIELLRDLV